MRKAVDKLMKMKNLNCFSYGRMRIGMMKIRNIFNKYDNFSEFNKNIKNLITYLKSKYLLEDNKPYYLFIIRSLKRIIS